MRISPEGEGFMMKGGEGLGFPTFSRDSDKRTPQWVLLGYSICPKRGGGRGDWTPPHSAAFSPVTGFAFNRTPWLQLICPGKSPPSKNVTFTSCSSGLPIMREPISLTEIGVTEAEQTVLLFHLRARSQFLRDARPDPLPRWRHTFSGLSALFLLWRVPQLRSLWNCFLILRFIFTHHCLLSTWHSA